VLARAVGAHVVMVNGHLAAYLARGSRSMWCWLPEDEPDREHTMLALAQQVTKFFQRGGPRGPGALISEINGEPAFGHSLAEALLAQGFLKTHLGLQLRRGQRAREDHDARR